MAEIWQFSWNTGQKNMFISIEEQLRLILLDFFTNSPQIFADIQ